MTSSGDPAAVRRRRRWFVTTDSRVVREESAQRAHAIKQRALHEQVNFGPWSSGSAPTAGGQISSPVVSSGLYGAILYVAARRRNVPARPVDLVRLQPKVMKRNGVVCARVEHATRMLPNTLRRSVPHLARRQSSASGMLSHR